MFEKKPKPPQGLDLAIDNLLVAIQRCEPYSSEYPGMVKQLTKLHALKVNETQTHVSKDVWITVAANLAGILIIVGYEHAHVVTTKALNQVFKLR